MFVSWDEIGVVTKVIPSGHLTLVPGPGNGTCTSVAVKCQTEFQLIVILTKLVTNFYDMRKTTVIESINKLPDEFSIDEIIERLIIIEKIDIGRQEVKEGKVSTEEQAKAKLGKWLN